MAAMIDADVRADPRRDCPILRVVEQQVHVRDWLETEPEALRERVSELLGDQGRLEQMASASRSLARPDAAARIADEVLAAATSQEAGG